MYTYNQTLKIYSYITVVQLHVIYFVLTLYINHTMSLSGTGTLLKAQYRVKKHGERGAWLFK